MSEATAIYETNGIDFTMLYAEADEDGRFLLDERAAIYQYDGKMSRAEAEAQTAKDWRDRRQ